MDEIGAQDIFLSTAEAFMEYLVSEFGDSIGLEQLHIGLLEARDVLHARMLAVPWSARPFWLPLWDGLDKEIKQIEGE